MGKKHKKLSKNDMVIIRILKKRKRMETKDFKQATSLSVREIRNSLKKLKNSNLIVVKINLQDTRRKFYFYNPDVLIVTPSNSSNDPSSSRIQKT